MSKFAKVMIVLFLFPLVHASSLPLLAVIETENGLEGTTAEMNLEIRPGKGNVFFDTHPVTKFDTQIATRYAKEVACDITNVDCDELDFFYTINSRAPIIGGPSAGAAAAALTTATLLNLEIREGISVTGTINSGMLVGPVGGVKHKIEAAADKKLKVVLIPKGRRFLDNVTNETLDLVEYGKELGVEVKEVSLLDEVVEELTGYVLEQQEELEINSDYASTMEQLSRDLCKRSEELKVERLNDSYVEYGNNLTVLGNEAFEKGRFYASASYCFGANVRYAYGALYIQNGTEMQLEKKIRTIREKIEKSDQNVDGVEIETITDLQTYMIVKERLKEAEELIESNDTSLEDIAYSIERLYSASAWATFFGTPGKRFELSSGELQKSCVEKLEEARERLQYAQFYVPLEFTETTTLLETAQRDFLHGDYALCLFRASKAKAEANVVLSAVGIERDEIDSLVEQKINAAKRAIVREQERGVFPILGYSFYEYATSLNESDPFSALLYSEYALELSAMNLYFQEKQTPWKSYVTNDMRLFGFGFVSGILIGVILTVVVSKNRGYKMNDKKSR